MPRVLDIVKEEREKFEKNLNTYLKNIKRVCHKHGLRCYLFGSRVRGSSLPSSDLDVLVVIPAKMWDKRWKLYDELRKACEDNPFVEIHIIRERDFEEMRKLYEPLQPLE